MEINYFVIVGLGVMIEVVVHVVGLPLQVALEQQQQVNLI
jgi:hypothetical protein